MYKFSDSDIQQIQLHGLTIDGITKQISDFQTGFPYSDIVSACVIGNGAFNYDNQSDKYTDLYDTKCDDYNIVKFVPASGAATRMFKDLFETGKNTAINALLSNKSALALVNGKISRYGEVLSLRYDENASQYHRYREVGNRRSVG